MHAHARRILSGFERTLLATSIALACPALAHGQATILNPITIDQVDWSNAAMGVTPNSEYAHLEFSYSADPLVPRFLNVVARNGPGGADQWIVQNLPLPDGATLGLGGETIATIIDLTPLGAVLGVSSAGQMILYTADATATTPLPLPPPNLLLNFTLIGSRLYAYGDDVSAVVTAPGYTPPAGPLAKPAWNGDPTFELRWRRNMPNEEQGTDQCRDRLRP